LCGFQEGLQSLNLRDRNGSTALFHAGWHGYFIIAELLLRAGADVNIRNIRGNACIGTLKLALYDLLNMRSDMAIERGNVELVKLFLLFGSDASMADVEKIQKRTNKAIHPHIIAVFEALKRIPQRFQEVELPIPVSLMRISSSCLTRSSRVMSSRYMK
jgi:hypothetical protein